MISMDFNGQVDRPEPRLRIAYGEFVSDDWGLGVLGGQAYATMLDLRAVPETLDFAGPAGLWQLREPLLRFTKSHAEGMITEVSIETPENVRYMGCRKAHPLAGLRRSLEPGLAGGEYIKHLRLAGLARDLRAEGEDGGGRWIRHSDGRLPGLQNWDCPSWGRRTISNSRCNMVTATAPNSKAGRKRVRLTPINSELETIGIFGTYGGIQHFWSDRWRSNLVYGYVNSDNPGICQWGYLR